MALIVRDKWSWPITIGVFVDKVMANLGGNVNNNNVNAVFKSKGRMFQSSPGGDAAPAGYFQRSLNEAKAAYLSQPEEGKLLSPEAKQALREVFGADERMISLLDRARGDVGINSVFYFNSAVAAGLDQEMTASLYVLVLSNLIFEKEKFKRLGVDRSEILKFCQQVAAQLDQSFGTVINHNQSNRF